LNLQTPTFFDALDQVGELLETYYGKDAVKIFRAGYYLELASLAVARAKDDEHGNDRTCGLWTVYGANALEAIKDIYKLPDIKHEEGKNDLTATFRDKLKAAVTRLEQGLEPRKPLFSSTSK
jgi:hypothetical protein